ncbi:MAG: hypothetical protein EB101_06855 [Chitinophagia bacterium]|nr:hypothetical protein [Chitinophagia bacterium]
MPSKTKKQHNFMAAVANNPAFAKKVGVPKSVGEEYLTADKGKKFMKGGMMKHSDIAKDKPMMKKVAKTEVKMHEKKMHGMKKGGMAKKMAGGGLAAGHKSADGIATKGKTKGKMITMKKGGYC